MPFKDKNIILHIQVLSCYPVYFASGFGGQCIMVIPGLDGVVVSTIYADSDSNGYQGGVLMLIINNYILTALDDISGSE